MPSPSFRLQPLELQEVQDTRPIVHAYQVFLQSTSGMIHEEMTRNKTPMLLENKRMKLFPWKDVIMRLVLIRSLSSTKHLLTGKNRKALFYTFALSPLLAFPKVITRLTSDDARKLVGVF